MTAKELCRRLAACGSLEAQNETVLLLEHFFARDRYAPFDDTEYDAPELARAIEARENHIPLQYILGEWTFYRQTYRVSVDCLIPRSDTEILVEEAIRTLPEGAIFADLCTGSGCIAVSVLAERPDTRCLALEKFPKTLKLARENAERNGVSARFEAMEADLFEVTQDDFGPRRFDAILSNPPYIPSDVISTLSPEVQKEPRAALDGGEDGLRFYRKILTLAPLLKKGGQMLLEIGFDQAAKVLSLAEGRGFTEHRILGDYGGNDRVAVLSGYQK